MRSVSTKSLIIDDAALNTGKAGVFLSQLYFLSLHHCLFSAVPDFLPKYTLFLQLPDGFTIRKRYASSDTLQQVADSLCKSGQLFRVDGVIHKGHLLNMESGWRRKTLEESGVLDGDELIITCALPREVDIAILSMERVFTVTVGRGENCWERIKDKLPLPKGKTFSVLNQRRLYYRRHNAWQSAVSDKSSKNFVYFDEEDGKQVNACEGSLYVDDFLAPNQGLRAAPRGRPYLWVFDDVLGYDDGRIISLNQSALFDSQYLACIYGARCFSKEGVLEEMYLRCYKGICNCFSGKSYNSFNEVFSSPDVVALNLKATYFYLLLRENDYVPQWNLSGKSLISILRRDGIDLRVRRDCIIRAVPRSFAIKSSKWTLPFHSDILQKDFTESAIYGVNKDNEKDLKKYFQKMYRIRH